MIGDDLLAIDLRKRMTLPLPGKDERLGSGADHLRRGLCAAEQARRGHVICTDPSGAAPDGDAAEAEDGSGIDADRDRHGSARIGEGLHDRDVLDQAAADADPDQAAEVAILVELAHQIGLVVLGALQQSDGAGRRDILLVDQQRGPLEAAQHLGIVDGEREDRLVADRIDDDVLERILLLAPEMDAEEFEGSGGMRREQGAGGSKRHGDAADPVP